MLLPCLGCGFACVYVCMCLYVCAGTLWPLHLCGTRNGGGERGKQQYGCGVCSVGCCAPELCCARPAFGDPPPSTQTRAMRRAHVVLASPLLSSPYPHHSRFPPPTLSSSSLACSPLFPDLKHRVRGTEQRVWVSSVPTHERQWLGPVRKPGVHGRCHWLLPRSVSLQTFRGVHLATLPLLGSMHDIVRV